MAALYLFNKKQRRYVRRFLDFALLQKTFSDIGSFSLALVMFCEEIGVEVFPDKNSSIYEDLRELLRIFGYAIINNQLIKLEQ